jgi:hypothetical protein
MGAGIEGGRRKSKSETTLTHDRLVRARLHVVREGEPDDFAVGVVSVCSSPLTRQERGREGRRKNKEEKGREWRASRLASPSTKDISGSESERPPHSSSHSNSELRNVSSPSQT